MPITEDHPLAKYPVRELLKNYIDSSQTAIANNDGDGRSPEYLRGTIDGCADALALVFDLEPDDILEFLED